MRQQHLSDTVHTSISTTMAIQEIATVRKMDIAGSILGADEALETQAHHAAIAGQNQRMEVTDMDTSWSQGSTGSDQPMPHPKPLKNGTPLYYKGNLIAPTHKKYAEVYRAYILKYTKSVASASQQIDESPQPFIYLSFPQWNTEVDEKGQANSQEVTEQKVRDWEKYRDNALAEEFAERTARISGTTTAKDIVMGVDRPALHC